MCGKMGHLPCPPPRSPISLSLSFSLSFGKSLLSPEWVYIHNDKENRVAASVGHGRAWGTREDTKGIASYPNGTTILLFVNSPSKFYSPSKSFQSQIGSKSWKQTIRLRNTLQTPEGHRWEVPAQQVEILLPPAGIWQRPQTYLVVTVQDCGRLLGGAATRTPTFSNALDSPHQREF